MDSKQKFIRNKYWKRKKRPHNATITVSIKKSIEQNDLSFESEEESKNYLKQPIPEEGWFPEYDSSSLSDIENFDSLINDLKIVPTSNWKNIDKNKEYDTNWLNEEPDNFQSNQEVNTKGKHTNKQLLTSEKNVENQIYNSNIEINIEEGKNIKSFDNEEAELEFLLSLKEPVFAGPTVIKKNIENERRITSNNLMQQTSTKSIDLEKWLDSVLDD